MVKRKNPMRNSHRIFVYPLFVIVYADRLRKRAENVVDARSDRGIDIDLHEGRAGFIEQSGTGILHIFGEINRFQSGTAREYICTECGYVVGQCDFGKRTAIAECVIADLLHVFSARNAGELGAEIECAVTDNTDGGGQFDFFYVCHTEECHAADNFHAFRQVEFGYAVGDIIFGDTGGQEVGCV